jgi:hypothetical protein
MAVHSMHIFDRKGKTLFTKRYAKVDPLPEAADDAEKLSEQRKLIFGMIFSLREVVGSLSPSSAGNSGPHSVRTGAITLFNYETTSGLRFVLYATSSTSDKSIRAALHHVYNDLWINCVTRSPLYAPTSPNVQETNFEEKLDDFLRAQAWFD